MRKCDPLGSIRKVLLAKTYRTISRLTDIDQPSRYSYRLASISRDVYLTNTLWMTITILEPMFHNFEMCIASSDGELR